MYGLRFLMAAIAPIAPQFAEKMRRRRGGPGVLCRSRTCGSHGGLLEFREEGVEGSCLMCTRTSPGR